MKKSISILFLISFLCLAIPCVALAHSGRTDEDGGHTDHSTGEYHWHHGMDDHQHYDIDHDGDLDCPYQSWTYSEETYTSEDTITYSDSQLNFGYNPSDVYDPPSYTPRGGMPTSTPALSSENSSTTNDHIYEDEDIEPTPTTTPLPKTTFNEGAIAVLVTLIIIVSFLLCFLPFVIWSAKGGREGVIERNSNHSPARTSPPSVASTPPIASLPAPTSLSPVIKPAADHSKIIEDLKKQLAETSAAFKSATAEIAELKKERQALTEKGLYLMGMLEDQKRTHRRQIDSVKSKNQNALSEFFKCAEQTLGEDYLFRLAGAPVGHTLSKSRNTNAGKWLPRANDGSEHVWGEYYTFYLATSSHPSKYSAPVVFHKQTCRYCNPNRPSNIVLLMETRATPCSFCKPTVPDLTWISQYEKLQKILSTLNE